jgi:hypothetical protein
VADLFNHRILASSQESVRRESNGNPTAIRKLCRIGEGQHLTLEYACDSQRRFVERYRHAMKLKLNIDVFEISQLRDVNTNTKPKKD